MIKNKLLLAALLTTLLISCKTEMISPVYHTNVLYPFPTQQVEVQNYDSTGVNFVITPVKPSVAQMSKVLSIESTDTKSDSIYTYEITTKYINDDEPLITNLAVRINQDSTLTSTHFVGDIELATSEYDATGKLVDVVITEDEYSVNSSEEMAKVNKTYACINREYQKLKKLADDDLLNDIVCTITLPICRTLMVLAAMQNCGVIK